MTSKLASTLARRFFQSIDVSSGMIKFRVHAYAAIALFSIQIASSWANGPQAGSSSSWRAADRRPQDQLPS
jgi:hypothetical protein